MEALIEVIKHHPLFQGIQTKELSPMLSCLQSYVKSYKKEEIIILTQNTVTSIGIILSGSIHMIKEDEHGHKTLLTIMKENELFGETFACGALQHSKVTFKAASDCQILFLPFYKVLHTCNMTCVFHHRLIENMVQLICKKNVQLMEKIEITSKKTLREKILCYLNIESQKQGTKTFQSPFGRVEMAEYLCADRSALTRELNNMRKEGIIQFEKNIFSLPR